MKKELYSSLALANALRALVALATAADTPPNIIYATLRSWVVAWEELWEKNGVPPSAIAQLQMDSCHLARELVADLSKMQPHFGKFPDEVPDDRSVPREGEASQ